MNRYTFLRGPADFRIPVAARDLDDGAFGAFCDQVLRHPVFDGIGSRPGLELCARGFGYPGAAALMRDRIDPASGRLPRDERDLPDLVAWRIARIGGLDVARVWRAVSVAWAASPLAVRERYTAGAVVLGTVTPRWTSPVAEQVRESGRRFEHALPSGSRALRADGRVHLRSLFDARQRLAQAFAEPVDATEDAARCAIEAASVPLPEALQWSGNEAAPPGLRLVSFFDLYGDLVGHGFACLELNGFVEQVYPPDGRLLLDAAGCLWHRRPVPDGMPVLPRVVFADAFRSPFVPQPIEPGAAALERSDAFDVPLPERHAIRTRDGRLVMGGRARISRVDFATPRHAVDERAITAFPSFRLVPSDQVDSRDDDWLRRLVPRAIDAESVDRLLRLRESLSRLAEQERIWALSADARRLTAVYTARTAAHAMPVWSARAERQMQGTGGMVQADALAAVARVRHRYPELVALSDRVVADYALDFHGIATLRARDLPPRSGEFLRYATLRNLGLDVASRAQADMVIAASHHLLRRTFAQEGIGAASVRSIAARLRPWHLAISSALALFDALDTRHCERRSVRRSPVAEGTIEHA